MCAVAPAGRQHATLASRALLAGRGASRSRSACPPAARRTAPRCRRSLVVRPQRLRTRNVGRGWCSLSLPPGSSRVHPGKWTRVWSAAQSQQPTAAGPGGRAGEPWRAQAGTFHMRPPPERQSRLAAGAKRTTEAGASIGTTEDNWAVCLGGQRQRAWRPRAGSGAPPRPLFCAQAARALHSGGRPVQAGGALERRGGRMGCCEQGPVRPLPQATAVWTCRRTYPRAQARGGRPAAPLRTRGAAHPCCSSADRARRRSRRTAGCRAVGVGLGLKGNGGGGGAGVGFWFVELGWRARPAGVRVTGRAAEAGGVTCRPPPAASSRPWRRSGRGRD